jgi:hypothetical protein
MQAFTNSVRSGGVQVVEDGECLCEGVVCGLVAAGVVLGCAQAVEGFALPPPVADLVRQVKDTFGMVNGFGVAAEPSVGVAEPVVCPSMKPVGGRVRDRQGVLEMLNGLGEALQGYGGPTQLDEGDPFVRLVTDFPENADRLPAAVARLLEPAKVLIGQGENL